MSIKIALAGNPNSGKTTLFNHLTGAHQYVGNWPGVTVEKKEGRLKGHADVFIQDLPGIYSLSPYTLEEVVARDYLIEQRPDVILNIVDATNLERNLYLTTQLTELGIPVVVVLNMMDLVSKRGDRIDAKGLGEKLGCPVYFISALKGSGTAEAVEKAVALANVAPEQGVSLHEAPSREVSAQGSRQEDVTDHGKRRQNVHPGQAESFARHTQTAQKHQTFDERVERALSAIGKVLENKVPAHLLRWYEIKALERDERVLQSLSPENDSALAEVTRTLEKELDDDAESILTGERYDAIARITAHTVQKAGSAHRESLSDKIDRIVTNRVLGLPIFAGIMFFIYAIAMGGWKVSIGTRATDFANDVLFGEWVPSLFDKLLTAFGVAEGGWVYGLVQDGIVAGVGAVLGFVPQMLVLFVLLAILEDIGYMARVAFVMDRVFRQFGLSGKSFIPCLVATGCGVPGIMASRTIEQERDRRLTVMTTTFVPCGAKLPIIGLIAGAIFGGSPFISVLAYFLGIGSVVLSGIILKKFKALAGNPAPFVMELPAYHAVSVQNVLRSTWERGWSFIKRAGSIILISSIILWFLASFGTVNGKFGMVDDLFADSSLATDEYRAKLATRMGVEEAEVNAMDASLLAGVGQSIAPVFKPVGFGNWKASVATITGLIAKEEVVGTFGVLYNYDDAAGELEENGDQIWSRVAADYTGAAALGFMAFNLLCAPCFAAIGAIRREMNNRRWTWAAIGWMTGWAYAVSLLIYQFVGLARGEFGFGIGTIAAVIVAGVLLYLLVRRGHRAAGEKDLLAVEAGRV